MKYRFSNAAFFLILAVLTVAIVGSTTFTNILQNKGATLSASTDSAKTLPQTVGADTTITGGTTTIYFSAAGGGAASLYLRVVRQGMTSEYLKLDSLAAGGAMRRYYKTYTITNNQMYYLWLKGDTTGAGIGNWQTTTVSALALLSRDDGIPYQWFLVVRHRDANALAITLMKS